MRLSAASGKSLLGGLGGAARSSPLRGSLGAAHDGRSAALAGVASGGRDGTTSHEQNATRGPVRGVVVQDGAPEKQPVDELRSDAPPDPRVCRCDEISNPQEIRARNRRANVPRTGTWDPPNEPLSVRRPAVGARYRLELRASCEAINRWAPSAGSCITCYAGRAAPHVPVHGERVSLRRPRRKVERPGRVGKRSLDGPTPSVRVATGVPVHRDVVRDGAPEKPLGSAEPSRAARRAGVPARRSR